MAFFDGVKNFIKKFKEAAKAGLDFNPLLESVEKEIEQLHAEGKPDDFKAKAKDLVEMKDKMMSILGPLGKLV